MNDRDPEHETIAHAINSYVPEGRAYDEERFKLQRWLNAAGKAFNECVARDVALAKAANAAGDRGLPDTVEEKFFERRGVHTSRTMFRRNADNSFTPGRYFSDAERVEAMMHVAKVLNDHRGFHVNDLDDATRGALLGAIVGAVLGAP